MKRVARLLDVPAVSLGVALAAAVLLAVAVAVESRALLVAAVFAATTITASAALLALLFARRASMRAHRAGELVLDVWPLMGLIGVPERVLPPLGRSSIDPRGARELLEIVVARRPRTVVELGPGTSTILLELVRRHAAPEMQIVSVEHDPGYAARVRTALEYFGAERCRVIEAPLEEQSIDGWRGEWYSRSLLDELPTAIDLLIVDGPANWEQSDQRYPALPVLRERLVAGGMVYVDDADRHDERRMVERWLERGDVETVQDGGDFVILRAR